MEVPGHEIEKAFHLATVLDHGLAGLTEAVGSLVMDQERLSQEIYSFFIPASELHEILARLYCKEE